MLSAGSSTSIAPSARPWDDRRSESRSRSRIASPQAHCGSSTRKAFPPPRTGVWRGETDFVTWQGQTIPVSQIIIGHHDSQGRLAFYSTIMRDMSERQRMEAALRHHSEELVAANAEL